MDLKQQIDNLINQIQDDKPEVDVLQLFIDDCLVPCEEQRCTLGETHRRHLLYCAENGYTAIPMRWFPLRLREKGFTLKIGRKNRYYVLGHYLIQK